MSSGPGPLGLEVPPVAAGASARPRRSRRGWWLLLTAVLIAGAAVPASFVLRQTVFAPTFQVESIRSTRAYQDPALLARAWSLPAAQHLRHGFTYQTNGSKCGPASLANVFRSLGEDVDEDAVLKGTGLCWTGICFDGLTLDQLAEVARHDGKRKVSVLRGLGYDAFKNELRRANDSRRRYIVNLDRGPLFGKGGGHHSPIGGYLEQEDLVFVLDVNRQYKPWLVDAHRLYESMSGVDSTRGATRGLLLIE